MLLCLEDFFFVSNFVQAQINSIFLKKEFFFFSWQAFKISYLNKASRFSSVYLLAHLFTMLNILNLKEITERNTKNQQNVINHSKFASGLRICQFTSKHQNMHQESYVFLHLTLMSSYHLLKFPPKLVFIQPKILAFISEFLILFTSPFRPVV